MEELKRCPFCGGEATVMEAVGEVWVKCSECHSSNGCSTGERAKAIEAWNTRQDGERFFPFEFEVWQGDEMAASASGPRDTALREAMHYAVQYAQDGQVRVFEVTRTLVRPNV